MPKADSRIIYLNPVSTKFKVRTEALPIRCEVCHQQDLFDPINNHCARCNDIALTTVIFEDAPVQITPTTPTSRGENIHSLSNLGTGIGFGLPITVFVIGSLLSGNIGNLFDPITLIVFTGFCFLNSLISVITGIISDRYLTQFHPGELDTPQHWFICCALSVTCIALGFFLCAMGLMLLYGFSPGIAMFALFIGALLGGLNGALNSLVLIYRKSARSQSTTYLP